MRNDDVCFVMMIKTMPNL